MDEQSAHQFVSPICAGRHEKTNARMVRMEKRLAEIENQSKPMTETRIREIIRQVMRDHGGIA